MTKVLVTGADGFIGSHLAERLVQRGYDVRAFVFYNSFSSWGWLDDAAPEIRGGMEVFPGDIRDPNGVRTAVRGCDIVLHLAALIGIPFSYHSPDAYVDTNIKGTLNVVQAARDLSVERVVITSTSEVYGSAQFVPISEEHPLVGQSPYAATKIGADQLALSFHKAFGLPVTVLRPFNTYGPRQSARAVIPTIISQIAAGKRSIKLGALHPRRDFSFVADTVEGFIGAMRCDDIVGGIVNIGSGFDISVEDTANMIAEVMGADIEIFSDDERVRPEASEVDRLLAETTKAKRLFNWSPQFSGRDGLRRGLELTANWFVDRANLSRYKHDFYSI